MLIISLTVIQLHNLLNVDNLALYSFDSEIQMTFAEWLLIADLVPQDESIAISLWDFPPAHQDAARSGGEGWDVGGSTGGH